MHHHPASPRARHPSARRVLLAVLLVLLSGGCGKELLPAVPQHVGDTTPPPPPPPPPPRTVASVVVSPRTADLPVQGSWPFHATALDSVADSIPGTQFVWTAADTTIAVVGSVGLVTGRAPGSTAITAAAPNGKSAAGVVTIDPPGAGPWPNEPSGLTVLSDQPWDLLTSLNWLLEFGVASVGLDLSAPLSPPDVLTETYPAGMAGGTAPGTETYLLGSGLTGLYMGLWWKVSDPWQGHSSSVNKIQFLFFGDGSDMPMVMYGPPGGPYYLRVEPEFHNVSSYWLTPNVNSVPVTLGVWHRIEWLVVEDPTTGTGVIRWWLDGQLVGDYNGVRFPPALITVYKLSPTWGGVGDMKSETDYYGIDHTHLSGR